ncbi:class I SAM-dependent methyltransferase [Clostridiaceae bacterium Marseille-Q4143]|nr:class I SAM-dependent methyltransferase [Clostridiaceae bacterium Marseille-Q4143]
MMGNYKFYTPPEVAECLMTVLPEKKYKNVIDICCGSWNLLKAANKVFDIEEYVGVDIDDSAGKYCLNGARFVCADGRKFAIEEKKKYDLVLSNPPFGCIKENNRVYDKGIHGKENEIKALHNRRYENEMMQANLLLSKKMVYFYLYFRLLFLREKRI